jgi:hypothetical protein
MRKRGITKIIVLSVFAVFMTQSVFGIVSNFDVDDEGWRITGDAQSGSVLPDYHSTGGNPDEYISADDDVQGGTWYFQAPSKFHGDFSQAYGTNIEFDLRQSSTSSQFDNVDISLSGSGTTLVYDTAYNPSTTWTSYSVLLTETSGWKVGSLSGSIPSQSQFSDVLSDITDIKIRGEYVSGPDTGGLDNVTVVPELASLVFIGIGSLILKKR